MSKTFNNMIWETPHNLFARSLTLGDEELPRGWTKNSVTVKPGTVACAFVDSEFISEIPNGEYTFHGIRQKWFSWKQGAATLLLIRSDSVQLPIDCLGLISADDVPLDIRIHVDVQIENPAVFFKNLMGPRKEFTTAELGDRLSPSVRQEVWAAVSELQIADLRNPSTKDLRGASALSKIATGVVSNISLVFKRYGLKVFGAEGLLIQSEEMKNHWEKVRQNNVEVLNAQLKTKRLGQEVDTHKSRGALKSELREFKNENEITTLSNELQKQTARIPLMEELRDAAISNKFDKAKSSEELKQLISAIDKQRLIRKEEMDQLAEGFDERKADREALRDHIITVLKINREQEVDALRIAVEHSLELANKKNELEMAEATNSVENLRWRNEIARDFEFAEKHREERKRQQKAKWDRIRETQRQKQDSSWELLQHQQREEAIRSELAYKEAEQRRRLELLEAENVAALEQQNIIRDRLRREFELEMGNQESDAQFERLKRVQDMNFESQSRQSQFDADLQSQSESRANTHEIEKLKTMGDLSAEALIASSNIDNAKALADLKIQEAKSEANTASTNSDHNQTLNEERLKMYEKLSETEKSKADAIADVFQQALKGQQTAVEQMISGLSAANNTQPATVTQRSATPPISPTSALEWHVILPGNNQSGPHSSQQIQSLIQQGQITAKTMVWNSSMGNNWTAINQVSEFSGSFQTPPPVSPPLPPAE